MRSCFKSKSEAEKFIIFVLLALFIGAVSIAVHEYIHAWQCTSTPGMAYQGLVLNANFEGIPAIASICTTSDTATWQLYASKSLEREALAYLVQFLILAFGLSFAWQVTK